MNHFRTLSFAIALLVTVPVQADELSNLVNRVPSDMNTVAIINVREINKSPRAVREKWRDNQESEYLAGAIAVPPWVTTVVIGADLHHEMMANGRSLALIPVENSVNSTLVASRENGVVQTVDDLTLVLSPKRGYFAFPAAGIVALSNTMPRQDFARWAREAKKADKPVVSEYLQKAVTDHKTAHVMIATDMRDLFDPTATRAVLQQSGVVQTDAQVSTLVNILIGIRGVVITCDIGEKTKAQVRIDFSVPMADFLPAFGRLWPKALEKAGLQIEEFKTAESKADGKSVFLNAYLSDTSLRRLLSLVAAPGDAVPEDGTARIKTPKEAAALATALRYYKGVNGSLDDLKAQGGRARQRLCSVRGLL